MAQAKEIISREQLQGYIEEAAKAAGYGEGFGVGGCDLSQSNWWSAYVRQSLEEQAKNNRVPEYLLTCARLAKERGAVVPREYVIVDHESSDYLDRTHMRLLRREIIAKRKIKGVIIPLQGRLTADAGQQSIFEKECSYYGVEFVFGDAPSGSDWASTTSRLIMAQAQALRLKTNRDNARAGNIGRVLKGMVPASRAAYGYRYRRDAEITGDGRVHVTAAWWEIDVLSTDGLPERGSSAWAVIQIFTWIGDEGRTLYWAANQLNKVGIKAPEGGKWSPGAMHNIVRHRCYTGDHAYNASSRVPNPRKPLGDITAEVRRTLVRPKAPEELVRFKVPALVTKGLWAKANARITERGRGRGKQGQTIRALLRSRIFCPQCGRPMVVRRDGRQNRSYYHCSKYFRPWADRPCNYRKFIPATWDELVWGDICTWLRDDIWIERQLLSQQSQDENMAKLIRLQRFKKAQAESKIVKVQEGFEGGIYNLDQAKKRIAELQWTMAKADREIQRLQGSTKAPTPDATDVRALKEELRSLRDRNLDDATFAEKLEVICGLGIEVYPSEDLKSMRVACQLDLDHVRSSPGSGETSTNLQANEECGPETQCGKVMVGSPSHSIHRTQEKVFRMVFAL